MMARHPAKKTGTTKTAVLKKIPKTPRMKAK